MIKSICELHKLLNGIAAGEVSEIVMIIFA